MAPTEPGSAGRQQRLSRDAILDRALAVAFTGRQGRDPVLIDFGYSKTVTASALTNTGRAVGTFGYIAPEVLSDGRSATHLSDQWSFARVMTEVLLVECGANVFASDARPHELLVELGELATMTTGVLRRALSPLPGDRFESVMVMWRAVRKALQDDRLLATPRPSSQQLAELGTALSKYFTDLSYEVVDTRYDGGGNLWVIGDKAELLPVIAPLQGSGIRFRYGKNGCARTNWRPGWFTKSRA